MARMIPSFMDDRTPPGERDVFNMLNACSSEWVVLHSLDLAPWNRRRRTEIDFVIIVPDLGAMCVEVKSHEDISFDGEKWSPPTIERSPFKQVADARGTFHRRLKNLAPQFASLPIVQCCVFPRSSFNLLPNVSVAPWELMDARAFRRFGNAKAFEADLRARIAKSIEADVDLKPLPRALSADQIEAIVKCCVPVQKFRPGAREEIKRRQHDLEQLLRTQQKPVLQLVELNERAIISGGAGTGKTLIAMEIAQRAAEKGKRVALLCFNQLIGNWMREDWSGSYGPSKPGSWSRHPSDGRNE
ncbi:NERD domain-containing protein [Bradyrhizobium sp. BR 1433]|uniref:nuclease-related domain-containing protein n=1 Tax=Bradyrhizobium sp. BR 1433 TaxID=3447967 RepID=UPI003EE6F5E7